MKICVISSTVFAVGEGGLKGYGGLEQLAWQQAEGLAKKGHEVALIAPQGSRCDFARVIPTGPPGGWDEAMAYNGYWHELLNFDVILDHTWQKHSYLLKMEGRLKAPVLGVCHAPVNTMMQELPPLDKPCFVCISKDQAAHFQALFSREARVAYNGVDLDFYAPTGVPRSGRFLFLARFSTIKGPDLAIDACRKAGVGLDLVGDTSITNEPEFLEQCKAKCDGSGIRLGTPSARWPEDAAARAICMIGPASRGECVHWFSQAHCLLHPNQRFREPFGLAPVEAMACGCPVLAWDNGAMRETVGKDVGWLVKSFDDLVFWVRDVGNSTAALAPDAPLRSRCREWAGQYSLPRMIDRYEQLCQEAIESGGW